MKRILTVAVISLLLLIVDNSLMPFFAIKGIYPSLLFVFAVSYSIAQDENSAVGIGVLSGLLQDIFFYGAFGINAFTNVLICFLSAKVGESIFKEKRLIPVLTIFAASLIKGIIMYVILCVLKLYMNPYRIIFISLYNMLIGIVVYSYVYKLSIKNFMRKDWKF